MIQGPLQSMPSSASAVGVRHSRKGRWARVLRRLAVLGCAGGFIGLAAAQGNPVPAGPPERSVVEWLLRLQQASRVPAYVGTFVVSSANGAMSSSRIWHVCEGNLELERVDALSGLPRSTYRRNDSVVTFLPEQRTVRVEQREAGGMFPNLLSRGQSFATADHYAARPLGRERVAGFDADIVQLAPRDELRFGYRVWSESRTGLVLKMQTVDAMGRVLEQAAFSELQFDTPVSADKLQQMMARTDGFRVERLEPTRTTAAAEGWELRNPIAGFQPRGCYRRPMAAAGSVVQWTFSDGLATVSLFLEPFDRQRHAGDGVTAMGATHTLTRRLADRSGEWWITAVGEVPPLTLKLFADAVQRKR